MLFPGGRLPLRIFEARYMDMARACLRDGTPFGVCLIVEGAEVGAAAVPADVGCLARIGEWDMPQLGLLQVVATGERRFRIRDRRVQADGLVRADVELMDDDGDAPVGAMHGLCVRLLERVIGEHAALVPPPHRLDSSSWVSARLAELLPLELAEKQRLLELADGRERLERISRVLPAGEPEAS